MTENITSSVSAAQKSFRSVKTDMETSEVCAVRTQWYDLGAHFYIKVLAIGVLLYYVFRSDIDAVVGMWGDPSWSHGFLIPLFSLYFIHQKKAEILSLEYVADPLTGMLRGQKPQKLGPLQIRANYLGLFFLIFILVFYVVNIVSASGYGYFSPLCAIASVGAVVLFLGGWRLVKYTWLPIAFLIFAVPLPDRYYVMLTMPMRQLSATVASSLLNLVNGLEATASGVVIDVIYKGQRMEPPLDVAEACSGMRLLMAFLALGVAMAYLHYRPIWQRIILLLSTIPIAVFCNIARVAVTGFIYVLLHPRYAQGIYHDMLGLSMLPLAFGLYGALAWFMSSLFIEKEADSTEDVVIRRRNKDV
jgi:exosortase